MVIRNYDQNNTWLVILVVLWCIGTESSEAGILPTLPKLSLPSLPKLSLPSLPTLSLPNPFDGARGWYLPNFMSFDFVKEFEKVKEFWNELPNQASNFLTKYVPQPIKNLLNFDPAPDWVPNPRSFQDDNENNINGSNKSKNDTLEKSDLTLEGSENRTLDFEQNDAEIIDEDEELGDDINTNVEKGNLHGLGRDVIRSLTNQFSNNITTGLDTDENFFNGLINGFKDKVKAIFPGTQWCGDGNVARTKKHLGFFYKTDSCCREHDNCPDYIEKDEVKYGLLNRGLFTRSNCECDEKFYKCLKESGDMISSQIGMAYFSVLGPQCFKKEYPIVDCRIRIGLTNRCIDYEFDNTTEKIYQWFDNPEY